MSEATLRERKKARTRETLVSAARRLFLEQGFEHTPVEAIAEAAGVSRRTFFRYFPSKTAVVFPHETERLERFRRLLAEGPELGLAPFAGLRRACLAIAQEFQEHRHEVVSRQPIIDASPSLIAHEHRSDLAWEEAIAAALQQGRGAAARRRARVLAGAAMGAIRATLAEWTAGGGRGDLIRVGQEAFDLLDQGVAAAYASTPDTPSRSRKPSR